MASQPLSFSSVSNQKRAFPPTPQISDSPINKKVDQVYRAQNFKSPFKKQKSFSNFSPEKISHFAFSLECRELFLDGEFYTGLSPQIGTQLEQIESAVVEKKISLSTFSVIREEIIRLVSSQEFDEETKLVELGSLYFYLVKEEGFRKKESYFGKRLNQIQGEIKRLQVDHERSVSKSQRDQVTSGKAAYLMRALARMIIAPNGKINPGGVAVVRKLLDSELQLVISNEQKQQIHHVLDSFENNPVFREGFLKPLKVHPDMEEIIRIDLKLEKGAQIVPEHLSWNLLIAFFSVFGQVDEGNCFAVAAATNIQIHHLVFVQELWREILETGSFLFERKKIPILPLLETRRTYERDFRESLPVEQASTWVGFDVVEQALGGREHFKTDGEMSFGDMMSLSFPMDFSYAKEVALSLKQNLLHQTLLAATQFVALNSKPKTTAPEEINVIWKSRLLYLLSESIEENYRGWISAEKIDLNLPALRSYCECELQTRLWLVDSRSWSHTIVEGRVTFDNHAQGFISLGEGQRYGPYYQIRRLFQLTDNGKLVPIDRISELKNLLEELVDDLVEDPLFEHLASAAKQMRTFLQTGFDPNQIARAFESFNGQYGEGISPQHYGQSDSVFLLQRGGSTLKATEWDRLEGKYFEPCRIIPTSEDGELAIQIGSAIRTYQKNFPSFDWEKPLLISTNMHAFNLFPKFVSDLSQSPNELLEDHLTGPGQDILMGHPDRKWQKRVIWETVGTEHFRTLFDEELRQEGRTFKDFFNLAISKLPSEFHQKFAENFHLSIQEIHLDDFQEDLEPILYKMGAPYPSNDTILQSFFYSGLEYLLPREMARLIQKWLFHNQIFSLSIFDIEEAICNHYNLPKTLLLGNLNWTPTVMEKHRYTYLVLRYDFARQTCRFFKRKDQVELPLEEDVVHALRNNTTLFFVS